MDAPIEPILETEDINDNYKLGCNSTCTSTEIVPTSLDMEDIPECNNTCESTEIIPLLVDTKDIVECNSTSESTEMIPTSMDTVDKAEFNSTCVSTEIVPTSLDMVNIPACNNTCKSIEIISILMDTKDIVEYNSTCGSTEIVPISLAIEDIPEYNNTCESTEILPTLVDIKDIVECNSTSESTEMIPTSMDTVDKAEYNSTCGSTEIVPVSLAIEDIPEYNNTCESTEIMPTLVDIKYIVECNSTCENTEMIPTSMDTVVKVENNSTCENAEIIPTSVVEYCTDPQLCFQPPPHSLHGSDLCDMESMESVFTTNIFTTTEQLALPNGEEFSQKNSRLELSSTDSTISNALDVSQESHIDSSTLSGSNSLLDQLRSILPVSPSHSIYARNSVSPTIEKMASTTNYNLCTQKADSGSSSDQNMSICEDQSLQPLSEHHEAEKKRGDHINGISNGKTDVEANESSFFNVEVKLEQYDSENDRPNMIYRMGTILVNSDDDTSSTMFSESSAAGSDGDNDVSDEEIVARLNARKITMSKNGSRTAGEIFPEELPPLEYLLISPGEDVVVEPIGTVSGIVGVLVIVKGDLNSPALYDDTVLFLQGRQPLGLIFEIFGTVDQPYYSVRFNTNRDIKDKDINVGDKVFFAPRADNLTKYVFISELKKIKCDDASWEHDNEPPPAHVEFSDDEEEKRARQRLRNKDRCSDENHGDFARRKKRRRRPYSENGNGTSDPHGPQLLQGDLNRNPFGNKDHKFGSSMTTRRSNIGSLGQVGNGPSFPGHRPHFSPRSSPRPLPPSVGAFRMPWPPHAGFGDRTGWNCQSGVQGVVPNVPRTGSLNMGCFGNSNTFSSHRIRPFPQFSGMSFPSPPITPSHALQLPQSSTPSQINSFSGGPYFRSNMEQVNTSAPPPLLQVPGLQIRQPQCFPVFNLARPPPVVSPVFNVPPPIVSPVFNLPPPIVSPVFNLPPPPHSSL